jgi:hypothetical protein
VSEELGRAAVVTNADSVDIVEVRSRKGGAITEKRLCGIKLEGVALLSVSWSPRHVLPGCLLVVTSKAVQVWRANSSVPVLLRNIPYEQSLRVYDANWALTAVPSIYLFHKNGVVYMELPFGIRENRADLAFEPMCVETSRQREFAIHKRSMNCAIPTRVGYLVGTSAGECIKDSEVGARLRNTSPVASGSPGRESRRKSADPFLVGNFSETITHEQFSVHPLIIREKGLRSSSSSSSSSCNSSSSSSSSSSSGSSSGRKNKSSSLLGVGVAPSTKSYSTKSVVYLEEEDMCFWGQEEANSVRVSLGGGEFVPKGGAEKQSVFEVLQSVGKATANDLSADPAAPGDSAGRVQMAFLGTHGDEVHADFTDSEMTLSLPLGETPSASALRHVAERKLARVWRSQVGNKGDDGADDARMQVDALDEFGSILLPGVASPDVMCTLRTGPTSGLVAVGSSKSDMIRFVDYNVAALPPLSLRKESVMLKAGQRCKGLTFMSSLSPTKTGDAVLMVTAGTLHKVPGPISVSTVSPYAVVRTYETVSIAPPTKKTSKVSRGELVVEPPAIVVARPELSKMTKTATTAAGPELLSEIMQAVKDVSKNMEIISEDFKSRMHQAEGQLSQITSLLSTIVSQQQGE